MSLPATLHTYLHFLSCRPHAWHACACFALCFFALRFAYLRFASTSRFLDHPPSLACVHSHALHLPALLLATWRAWMIRHATRCKRLRICIYMYMTKQAVPAHWSACVRFALCFFCSLAILLFTSDVCFAWHCARFALPSRYPRALCVCAHGTACPYIIVHSYILIGFALHWL